MATPEEMKGTFNPFENKENAANRSKDIRIDSIR